MDSCLILMDSKKQWLGSKDNEAGGMGNFNPNESNDMIKVVNRKSGMSFNVDCCLSFFLHSTMQAGIDIDDDMALIDYTNGVIEFEGNDDSFHNILKGKL